MTQRLEQIIIAGNGYLPYQIAYCLQHKFHDQQLRFLVVDLDMFSSKATSPVELLQSLGSMKLFHTEFNLPEAEFVKKTKAQINLGFDYRGFRRRPGGELFADADYGFSLDNLRFSHLFAKLVQVHPEEKLEDYCLTAKLARLGRFTPPSPNPKSLYASIHYGYRLTASAYKEFFQAKLLASKVQVIKAQIAAVQKNDAGFIDILVLADGERLQGDLFIDASEARSIKNALGEGQSLSSSLPAPLTFAATTEACAQVRPHSQICAMDGTLQVTGDYLGQDHRIIVSNHDLPNFDQKQMRYFTDPLPWQNNCIAMGHAFTNRLPVLIDNSHFHQNALLRLLELWPRSATMAMESRVYNRNTQTEIEHIVDMDRLHLAQALDCPEMLSETMRYKLELFKRNGKVAYYEKEVLQEQQWPVLFHALGIAPLNIDRGAPDHDNERLTQDLLRIKSTLAKAAEAAPDYQNFIQPIHR